MQGPLRKIIQAISYEAIAMLFITPAMALVYQQQLTHSAALSLMISTVALGWNMLFNLLFEAWERRQARRERTFWRRTLHATGFEGGLVVLLVPLMAWWLQISLIQALLADIALFVFFFFYAFAFQWGFDRVFGVPESAQAAAATQAV